MHYHPRKGYILIEILIAMSIGILLMTLLMEMYLASHESSTLETALSTIQQNARSFTAILTREIHAAGNIGCARLTQDFPIISLPNYPYTAANKITSTASNQITIRHADYPAATLAEEMKDHVRIYLSNNIAFKPGDILLISNCERAEMFKVQTVRKINGLLEITSTAALHDRYEKYAEVSRFSINQFYLAKTGRHYSDGSAIYALFIEDIHHRKSELVAGIQQMQIKYTIQNAEGSPSAITDWAAVSGVAMNIELHAPPLKKIWHVYAALHYQRTQKNQGTP
jgi:hypothetical protein